MKSWMVVAIFLVAIFLWVGGIFSVVKGAKMISSQVNKRVSMIEKALE